MTTIETKKTVGIEAQPSTNPVIDASGPSVDVDALRFNQRVAEPIVLASAAQAAREKAFGIAVSNWQKMTGIKEMTFHSDAASPSGSGATDKIQNIEMKALVDSFNATFRGYSNSATGAKFIDRLNEVGAEVRFERNGTQSFNMAYQPQLGGGWVKINVSLMNGASAGDKAFQFAEEISHMTISGKSNLEEIVAKVNATYAANKIGAESKQFSHSVQSVNEIVSHVQNDYNDGKKLGGVTKEKIKTMIDDLKKEGLCFIPPQVEQELYRKAPQM